MSIQNRARHVQRAANIPYTDALHRVQALGARPSELAADYGWSVTRATIYLIDPELDPERREAWSGSRYVHEERCVACEALFFLGLDKKGIATTDEKLCPKCSDNNVQLCEECNENVIDPSELLICDDCMTDKMNKDD